VTRYTAGQILLALAFTVLGAIKAARLLVDAIDDATADLAGLS
jgi:hypothetical protein